MKTGKLWLVIVSLVWNLLMFSGAANAQPWLYNGSDIYYNSGMVGIGTTLPEDLLHIYSDSTAPGFVVHSDRIDGDYKWATRVSSDGELRLSRQGSGCVEFAVLPDGGFFASAGSGSNRKMYLGSDGSFSLGDDLMTGSATTNFYVDPNGNVGIGTASPTGKLQVDGKIRLGKNGGQWISDNNELGIYFQSKGASTSSPDMLHTAGRIYGDSILPGYGEQALVLEAGKSWESSTEPWVPNQLVLKGNGNVGINTASPTQKLHVQGNLYSSGNITLANNSTIDGVDLSDYSAYFINSAGSSGKVWKSDGNGRGYWGTDSNSGDNMGNHSATQNIRLNGRWLSNDGGNEGIRVSNSGYVGIGTYPYAPLHVNAGANDEAEIGRLSEWGLTDVFAVKASSNTNSLGMVVLPGTSSASGGGGSSISDFLGTVDVADASDGVGVLISDMPLLLVTYNGTGYNSFLYINTDGNIGVNTAEPAYTLHVAGTIRAEGADVAEPFEMTDKRELAMGDVVIIDPDNPLHVKKSERAYDTRVAGIVSSKEQAGYIAGGRKDGSSDKPIALVGRVLCKVSAENGKINVGDLLTTSGIPGYAMKAVDSHKRQGATLGKALQTFEGDKGRIMVLVALL